MRQTSRSSFAPNLPRGEQARTRFFNTAAFIDRGPVGPRFRYGNSARNTIIGPGIITHFPISRLLLALSRMKKLGNG